jgi:Cys-rich repeat protein
VACNGDNATSATEACPTSSNPYCEASGACGKCTNNTDCMTGTHAGPFCDATTGACGAACTTDAECGAGKWCEETEGVCTPQLANGTGMPTDVDHTNPTLNGTCTTAAATVVCKSGVCDTKDNECGYGDGEGPCTSSNGATVCQSGVCASGGANGGLCVACASNSECPSGTKCNSTTNVCVRCATPSCATTTVDAGPACQTDENCPQGDYCTASGACAPTLPEGASCTRATECQSDQCTLGICSIVVSSGSGIFCSVRAPGDSENGGGVGLFACAMALAGARFRRRRYRQVCPGEPN